MRRRDVPLWESDPDLARVKRAAFAATTEQRRQDRSDARHAAFEHVESVYPVAWDYFRWGFHLPGPQRFAMVDRLARRFVRAIVAARLRGQVWKPPARRRLRWNLKRPRRKVPL